MYIGMRPNTKRSLRNYDIRQIVNVDNITERCRKAISRWFEHMKRREDNVYFGRNNCTTRENKNGKNDVDINVRCLPIHESYREKPT